MTTTVSAKIPDEMKEGIDREDINVSEVFREALADELAQRRRARLTDDASALGESIGDRVDTEDIANAVRETREEH